MSVSQTSASIPVALRMTIRHASCVEHQPMAVLCGDTAGVQPAIAALVSASAASWVASLTKARVAAAS